MTGAIYLYQAVVTGVIDGDTCVVDLDMGLHLHMTERRVRIAHINAPELGTPEGVAAATFARFLLPSGSSVGIKSLTKPDKYGRLLADVTLSDGSDFAARMIAAGHAVAYEGGAS